MDKNYTDIQLEKGYTRIANEFMYQFSKLRLSGGEWQVLWSIMNKTWTWHKKQESISVSDFQKKTGLTRAAILRAVSKLVAKSILVVNKDNNTNVYSLNKRYNEWTNSKKYTSCNKAKSILVGSKKYTSSSTKSILVASDTEPSNNSNPTPKYISKETLKRFTNVNDENHQAYGNAEINLILETYKKTFGFSPTDRKPRFVASTMAKQIHSWLKKYQAARPDLSFNEVIRKTFDWYAKRDVTGETLDVVRRKMRMLLEITEQEIMKKEAHVYKN